jgi:hypothetical protein
MANRGTKKPKKKKQSESTNDHVENKSASSVIDHTTPRAKKRTQRATKRAVDPLLWPLPSR